MIELTLEPRPDSLHPAWAAEIRRRVEEIDSGKVIPIPWEDVRKRIHEKLDARDPANV